MISADFRLNLHIMLQSVFELCLNVLVLFNE